MSFRSQTQKLQHHLERVVARLQRRILAGERASRRFSRARLALALLGAVLTYLLGQMLGGAAGWWCFVFFTCAFMVIARRHERLEHSLRRHRIWLRLKSEDLSRINLEWQNLPQAAPPAAPSTHPFASDLNLEGERGLLHLLDNTTSSGGSARLREWLLQPLTEATPIRARQTVVAELKPLVRFRAHLALQGSLLREDQHERWEGEKLVAWLRRESQTRALRQWVIGLTALAALNLALFVLRQYQLVPLLWPFTLLAYAYAYVLRMADLSKLFDDAFLVETKLRPFQTVAQYLERHPFTRHAQLMRLCAPFRTAGQRPSEHVRRARRIAEAASMQRGQIFWLVLNLLLPWDFYFWYRLEKIKAELRIYLPQWLEAWYELESYNALAHFAYLHPEYIFPEVEHNAAAPLLRARNLGHPLLPARVRVCNDLQFEQRGEVVLITGSNMSGKSTFLRAAGVNLLLAYSGAPVCATQLQTVPMRLFTCMAVSDSVTDGISFFYAEVKRLKALLQTLLAEETAPLFFLVDEIFRGTNNRERLLGSRAYIRALAQSQGSGMISTHDLELVELAQEIARLRNYHFREHVEDGRMIFDFLLREGPCPTTNALKIMALEGLPIG